jgi:hypothetical protein
MKQADARAEARNEAIDDRSDVRTDAIKREHIAATDSIQAADQPGQSASKEMVNVSEDRALYQSKAEARLDKLAVRIDAAKQKMDSLGSRTPTGLRDDLKTTVQEHKQLKHDVGSLRDVPASRWESATDKVEHRLSSLDDRVTKLTNSIESV